MGGVVGEGSRGEVVAGGSGRGKWEGVRSDREKCGYVEM